MVYCTRCVPMIDSTLVKSLFTDLFMFTVQCVASSRRLLQNAEFFLSWCVKCFCRTNTVITGCFACVVLTERWDKSKSSWTIDFELASRKSNVKASKAKHHLQIWNVRLVLLLFLLRGLVNFFAVLKLGKARQFECNAKRCISLVCCGEDCWVIVIKTTSNKNDPSM